PSMGVERDRFRRAGVPARLQEPRHRCARAVGGRRPLEPRPGRQRRRHRVCPSASRRSSHAAVALSRSQGPAGGRGPAERLQVSALTSVRRRNESAWLLPNDGTRVNHQLRRDMRRFDDEDEVDIAIVGAGAGGSVLLQRLARAGWRAVAFDAGPFWDPDKDWVSDEAGSHHLYWTEPRVITGDDPVPLGSNNSGRGVGGSMVHFAGYVPRLHPSDFSTFSSDGVGADWPISYSELRR